MTPAMTQRLSIEGGNVLIDGKSVFTIPIKHATMDTVQIVGFREESGNRPPSTIYVGSGTCCHGHLYMLEMSTPLDDVEGQYHLDRIISVDTNVMDILPVVVDHKKSGFPNDDGALVVGYGCAGAGVRLLGTYYPRLVDVFPEKLFREHMPDGQHVAPRFKVDAAAGRILLAFLRSGWREKPGKRRDPNLPACLVNTGTEEYFVSSEVHESVDITGPMNYVGVDIPKTIELSTSFHRLTPR